MRIPVRLEQIPYREVLRYLGWRGTEVDARICEQLKEAQRMALDCAAPAVVMERFRLKPDGELKGTTFSAQGKDALALLKDCEEAALMAATLGAESERMILRAQASDPVCAMILDAVLSAAIEAACDQASAFLERELIGVGLHATHRFSPGYGDMPIGQVKQICEILDTARKIGLTVSSSGLMIPRKSVCAIIGIGTKATRRENGCEHCGLKETCMMRKAETGTCANAEG